MLKNNLKYFQYFTVCTEGGILIVRGTCIITERYKYTANIYVTGKYVWLTSHIDTGDSGSLTNCTIIRPANEIEIEFFKRQYNES